MYQATRHSRVRFRLVSAVALLSIIAALLAVPGPASARQADKDPFPLRLQAPRTPNPHLAYLSNAATANYGAWTAYLNAAGKQRSSQEAPGSSRRGLRISEAESPGAGTNDSQGSAQFIRRFGTGSGDNPVATISGTAPAGPVGSQSSFDFSEPNGAFGTAVSVVLAPGDSATGSGVIGDEPDPFDFDFVKIPGLQAGQVLVGDIDTPPDSGLDSFVAVWNPDLAPFELDANDDSDGLDSRLEFVVPEDGDYYFSVAGFGAFVPLDPADPSSPSVTGDPGSQGSYDFTVSIVPPPTDLDFYSFDLEAGDIIGAAGRGVTSLELRNPSGDLLIGSAQNVTFIHPEVSPLPGNGNAALSYVVDSAGTYALAAPASGAYEVDLAVFRPAKERSGQATQTLFIDFDGATVNNSIFGTPPIFAVDAQLSPLSDFLAGWGLDASDEDAVIDAIMAAVEENLAADLRAVGANGDRDGGDGPNAFDIEILNSRDHPDPWGQRYVSRVIVGGTIPQLEIPTVGIAQSIDVGDFESEETAVTLLDLFNGTGPFPAPAINLNEYELAPGASIIDLIGVAVGNVTAHEAGHFFANWHTDQFNERPNIQDQGGNAPGTFGVGPDGIFGSADDVDVDFGLDDYVPNEGFRGFEDTLQTISFGLSTGNGRGRR